MEIGKQHKGDNEFKRKARLHQSQFRAEVLQVEYDGYGNMLREEDGKRGLNFYNDFNILQAVRKRYGDKYNKHLYSNLLRSEHIPFNFFVPLLKDFEYAKKVFNEVVRGTIKEIIDIQIEYKPKPPANYLNDNTSFDVAVSYLHEDNYVGLLGIEVKYTEQAYLLKSGSKEERGINSKDSKYYVVAHNSGLFSDDAFKLVFKNNYRQIFRNQLLGESIKQVGEICHFTSVTLYPSGNSHFAKAISNYQDLLVADRKDCIFGLTYEEFIKILSKHTKNPQYVEWINYLIDRYLFNFE